MTGPASRRQSKLRRWVWISIVLAVLVCLGVLLLRFGGEMLVRTDSLPSHAQAAIVLNGSAAGVAARIQAAVELLKRGVVDCVMISIPPTNYWGENLPAVANHYFEKRFGGAIANRTVYCVSDAGSTFEEAHALGQCLRSGGWNRVIIVTSNYHTRRARRIWALAHADSHFQLYVDGVADGDFKPKGWWRNRGYAKTWLLEATKLAWESVFGPGPWKSAPSRGTLVEPPIRSDPANAFH